MRVSSFFVTSVSAWLLLQLDSCAVEVIGLLTNIMSGHPRSGMMLLYKIWVIRGESCGWVKPDETRGMQNSEEEFF
jgi:hypothetical protein